MAENFNIMMFYFSDFYSTIELIVPDSALKKVINEVARSKRAIPKNKKDILKANETKSGPEIDSMPLLNPSSTYLF